MEIFQSQCQRLELTVGAVQVALALLQVCASSGTGLALVGDAIRQLLDHTIRVCNKCLIGCLS